MNCSMIKQFLDSSFSSVFSCSQVGDYLSISTPFNYPDGDIIEVFLIDRSGRLALSDMGETLRYLSSYDIDMRSYSKRQQIIDDVLQPLHTKLINGTLYYPVSALDAIAEGIFEISQTIIRICDLLYTVRGSSRAAFVEEVKDFLDIQRLSFQEDVPIITNSGHRYNIDLGVEVNGKLKLLELLNAPSKPTHRPNTDRLVAMWADIDSFTDYPVTSRITLLDDNFYSWRTSDIILLEKFSTVSRWTDKPKLIETLKFVS